MRLIICKYHAYCVLFVHEPGCQGLFCLARIGVLSVNPQNVHVLEHIVNLEMPPKVTTVAS